MSEATPIIDTTTAHGRLVFGMFALMAEYDDAWVVAGALSPALMGSSRSSASGLVTPR